VKSEIPKGGVFKRLAKIFSIITGISIGSTFLLVLGLLAGVTLFVRTETFQRTFKNRIVEIVRGELDAEISCSSANVDVLSFSPSVSFAQIVFQPKKPELRTELKRFEVSISVFSLPLLAFNQLVIAEAVIDGLNYKISDFDALERWLDGLRPRDALVPIRLQTSVESISLIDAQLEVDLKKGKRWPLDTRGHFFVESFLVGLDADQPTLSGLVSFKDLQ